MRIAVVGDVHRQWTAGDSRALDAGDYDLVLFVGDLPGPLHGGVEPTARAMGELTTRAMMIPGNPDGTSPLGVLSEAVAGLSERPGMADRARARLARLQAWLGPVELVGYSAHPFPEHGVTLIAGRPHAMDGRRVSFAPLLGATHAIETLGQSIARFEELLDATQGPLLFLGHNGPRGLGRDLRAPWSVAGIDLGDPDLAAAIHRARQLGRRVIACVAGHIHHRGERRWWTERDGTGYLNAARVPGERRRDGVRVRHHVRLELDGTSVRVSEQWWPDQ